jgi:hypothetical protein
VFDAVVIETSDRLPYEQPFSFSWAADGEGLDLGELAAIDPRWPSRSGRTLWFRIRPPFDAEQEMWDDQVSIMGRLGDSDAFADFVTAGNKNERWNDPSAKFIHWLFCGTRARSRR